MSAPSQNISLAKAYSIYLLLLFLIICLMMLLGSPQEWTKSKPADNKPNDTNHEEAVKAAME